MAADVLASLVYTLEFTNRGIVNDCTQTYIFVTFMTSFLTDQSFYLVRLILEFGLGLRFQKAMKIGLLKGVFINRKTFNAW